MKKMISTLMLALTVVVGLAACNNGGGDSGSGSGSVVAQAIGNCQSGTVYTAQYGCLPQGGCPSGYGQYQVGGTQPQCVAASTCGATNGVPGYTGYNTGYNPYGTQGACGVGTQSIPGYTGYTTGYTGYTTGYTGYGYGGYTGGYGGGYGMCAAGFNYMGGMCFNMMNPSIWYRVY